MLFCTLPDCSVLTYNKNVFLLMRHTSRTRMYSSSHRPTPAIFAPSPAPLMRTGPSFTVFSATGVRKCLPPAILALAPNALVVADALAPTLFALVPLPLVHTDGRAPALHRLVLCGCSHMTGLRHLPRPPSGMPCSSPPGGSDFWRGSAERRRPCACRMPHPACRWAARPTPCTIMVHRPSRGYERCQNDVNGPLRFPSNRAAADPLRPSNVPSSPGACRRSGREPSASRLWGPVWSRKDEASLMSHPHVHRTAACKQRPTGWSPQLRLTCCRSVETASVSCELDLWHAP